MNSSQGHFFGFGSLVNLRTHQYHSPQPSSVQGWQREWVSSNHYEHAFLSVRPNPDMRIDGMLACTQGIGWDALDEREKGYNRHELNTSTLTTSANVKTVAIYVGSEHSIERAASKPILQSYLDVVFQGYLDHYGEAGIANFIATTDSWDRTIQNDRDTPIYPRAQTLTSAELKLVDHYMITIPK